MAEYTVGKIKNLDGGLPCVSLNIPMPPVKLPKKDSFNFGKLNFYRRLEVQKVKLQQAIESVCAVPTVLEVEEKEFYDVQAIRMIGMKRWTRNKMRYILP